MNPLEIFIYFLYTTFCVKKSGGVQKPLFDMRFFLSPHATYRSFFTRFVTTYKSYTQAPYTGAFVIDNNSISS